MESVAWYVANLSAAVMRALVHRARLYHDGARARGAPDAAAVPVWQLARQMTHRQMAPTWQTHRICKILQAYRRVALPPQPPSGHPDNLTEWHQVAQAQAPAPQMQPQAAPAPAGTQAAAQQQGPEPGQAAGSGHAPDQGTGAQPKQAPPPFGYVPGQAPGSGGGFASQGTPHPLPATARARSKSPRGGRARVPPSASVPAPAGLGFALDGCPAGAPSQAARRRGARAPVRASWGWGRSRPGGQRGGWGAAWTGRGPAISRSSSGGTRTQPGAAAASLRVPGRAAIAIAISLGVAWMPSRSP